MRIRPFQPFYLKSLRVLVQDLHELDAGRVSAAVCYVGVGSREQAVAIACAVVGERLAAAANVIDGVSSVYWWRGEARAGRGDAGGAEDAAIPAAGARCAHPRAAQLRVPEHRGAAGRLGRSRLSAVDRGRDPARLSAPLALGAADWYNRRLMKPHAEP